jgi:hypothetical protein
MCACSVRFLDNAAGRISAADHLRCAAIALHPLLTRPCRSFMPDFEVAGGVDYVDAHSRRVPEVLRSAEATGRNLGRCHQRALGLSSSR